jgi:hypothetical protein
MKYLAAPENRENEVCAKHKNVSWMNLRSTIMDFENEAMIPDEFPAEFKLENSKIMYIEDKSSGLEGEARIGRIFFSKTGKTL